jgi:hypothetical protein
LLINFISRAFHCHNGWTGQGRSVVQGGLSPLFSHHGKLYRYRIEQFCLGFLKNHKEFFLFISASNFLLVPRKYVKNCSSLKWFLRKRCHRKYDRIIRVFFSASKNTISGWIPVSGFQATNTNWFSDKKMLYFALCLDVAMI